LLPFIFGNFASSSGSSIMDFRDFLRIMPVPGLFFGATGMESILSNANLLLAPSPADVAVVVPFSFGLEKLAFPEDFSYYFSLKLFPNANLKN
jgi:hypothetical protein